MLVTNFFFLLYRKNQDVNVISFFSLLSKNLIFIPKKIKTKYIKKKKVDNKFIINSSPCLYSPNESGFFFYI